MTLARQRSEAGPIDPTTGPWSNRAMTDQILAPLKHPQLLMIHGVGHLPNLEAEREFNDALRIFLRGIHQPEAPAARPGCVMLPAHYQEGGGGGGCMAALVAASAAWRAVSAA